MEEVKDLVIMEQLVNSLPEDIRVWVKERKPKISVEAGELADDYAQARKSNVKGAQQLKSKREERQTQPLRCHSCGKVGHIARDYRMGAKPRDHVKDRGASQRPPEKFRRDLKDIQCFNCHQKGHYSSNCPHNAMYCRGNKAERKDKVIYKVEKSDTEMLKAGIIEGNATRNILLDTGCSRTLVHRDFVPSQKLLEGEALAIRCAHGDTVLYPLARVTVEIDGQAFEVQAAVADRLPLSMLLGTDVPHLSKLVSGQLGGKSPHQVEEALVVTRARARQQSEEEKELRMKDANSGVQPHDLDSTVSEDEDGDNRRSVKDLPQLDDDLFMGGREKKRLTKQQKRENKKKYSTNNTEPEEPKLHHLDISAEELKILQETDPTLKEVREAANGHHPSKAGVGFYREKGLLYRRYVPPGKDMEDMAVTQLVLPLQCRQTVLKLAHEIPLTGHLGRDKTAQRILQRFYWPTRYKDVAEICRTCGPCQKTSHYQKRHAPLIALPIIDVPFKRIAMDIVGPLPRGRPGNRYFWLFVTMQPDTLKPFHSDLLMQNILPNN